MGKPTVCIGENKGADQLRGNREDDQSLCIRCSDSTVPLLLKSEFSRFYLFSVTVQVGLCRTWSETTCWFSYEAAHVLDKEQPDRLAVDNDDKALSTSQPFYIRCILPAMYYDLPGIILSNHSDKV